ncbi:hypothetical protein ABKN59_009714 [Abortiporus biennis]
MVEVSYHNHDNGKNVININIQHRNCPSNISMIIGWSPFRLLSQYILLGSKKSTKVGLNRIYYLHRFTRDIRTQRCVESSVRAMHMIMSSYENELVRSSYLQLFIRTYTFGHNL